MKRLLLTLLSVLSLLLGAKAQDPHFSQYFASPLTLNPALTGFFDGDYRLAVNQRRQWWNVGPGYSTTNVAADVKLWRGILPEDDTFAIGLNGMFDKSLGGALQSNYASVSAAYHKSLAAMGSQTLSLGFQASFANRYLDYNQLSFASQFNGTRFDPTMPASIDLNNSSTNYITLNTGLMYAVHADNANVYLGTALYHFNRPTESLFNASGDRVPMRATVHSGGEFNLDPRSSVLFSGVYMHQANFNDTLLGGAYGLQTSDGVGPAVKLYLGFWYRMKDAYIPYVGMDYGNFSAGINYSMPQTTITSYSPRTVEFSLIFRRKSDPNMSNICPRF